MTKVLESTKTEAEDGEIKTPTTAKLQDAPANPFSTSKATTSGMLTKKPGSEGHNGEKLSADVLPEKDRGSKSQSTSSPAPHPNRSILPVKPDLKLDAKSANLPVAPARSRQDAIRSQTDSSKLRHPTHSLPSRPEVPQIASRVTNIRNNEKPNERTAREGRDSRESEHRRNERVVDDYRDQRLDRHVGQRPYDRSDRLYPNDREKQEPTWGGEKPPHATHDDRHLPYPRPPLREDRSDRPLRERSHADSSDHHRDIEAYDSRSRESSKAPLRTSIASHSDRTASKPMTEPEKMHTSFHPDRRAELVRADNTSLSTSQRGSRAPSPSRRDDRLSRSDYRDDRSITDNRRHIEEAPLSRPRHDDMRLPTGPRTERHNDLGSGNHSDRPRENFRAPLPSTHPESTNNRSSQDLGRSRQYESSYGRLNQDPPAGPRMANGNHPSMRAPHNTTPSQSVGDQGATLSSSPVERQAPTGPASSRISSRSSVSIIRPAPISTSIPPVSTSDSPDTAGVHPDRLKAIQSTGGSGSLENSTYARNTQVLAESPVVPRGPSGAQATEQTNSTRPSGPPPGNVQADRSRSDKRFAGINNVLSQSERFNQAASFRGRGGRSSVASSPITGAPQRRDFSTPSDLIPPTRQDSFPNRQPSGTLPARDDDSAFARRGMRSDERRPPRARDARSASPRRHVPQVGSREDMRGSRLDDTHPRDHRGRGGPPPPLPMTDGRDRRAPRDNLPVSKGDIRRDGDRREDWGNERMAPERRDRPERRESGMSHPGSMRDSGMEGGGSGRKRPRVMEEMYEQSKPAYDHSKRPRRG